MGRLTCSGNGEEHCCWLYNEECMFVESGTIPGRRWVCGLRRELGTWEKVYSDERYQTLVKPVINSFGLENCGAFEPAPGVCCNTGGDG